MAALRVGRYECQEYVIPVAGRELRLVGPKWPHALHYDPCVQQRWQVDGYKPYWAQPWPAAVMLAEHLLRRVALPPEPILELGAGLGIVGMALSLAGHRVVVTDYDEDALLCVRASAARNGIELHEVRHLDWREPPPVTFAVIVASEVLYRREHHAPLVEVLRRCLKPGGQAFFSDMNHPDAGAFPGLLRAAGLTCEETATEGRAIPAFDARDGRVLPGTVYSVFKPV